LQKSFSMRCAASLPSVDRRLRRCACGSMLCRIWLRRASTQDQRCCVAGDSASSGEFWRTTATRIGHSGGTPKNLAHRYSCRTLRSTSG
jgi:hypothetical protein